jgi:hypothetical protein
VTERDRPAVRVHVFGVVGQAQAAQHGQRLRRERLVQLDQVETGHAHPGAGQQLAGGRHRPDAHDPRLDADRGARGDPPAG